MCLQYLILTPFSCSMAHKVVNFQIKFHFFIVVLKRKLENRIRRYDQGRSQKVPKGGAKSRKGKSRAKERKIFAFFLCKRDQNRTKTVKT